MRNLYVVRHTESLHHVQGLYGGWYDTSLTEKGRVQATKVATGLYNHINISNIPIYSSDLKRCSEMAYIFARVFNSPVILDKNLREMSGGDNDGKTQEWQKQNIIPPIDGNRLDHRVFNNAESRREVGTRVYDFLNQIAGKSDNNVIIITHRFVMTFLIMAWLRVPIENMDYCEFKSNPGSVTLLNEDDYLRNRNVVYVNRLDFLTK
ncbi:MAG TPA: histidine phosphatase family protein [Dehalococcoidales bacterium]